MPHFPKKSRYTLGGKIDALFLEAAESVYTAGYMNKEEKSAYIQKAIGKFDLLKFFLQIAWETKALDNARYEALSEPLTEIGRMLGGWSKQSAGHKK